MALKSCCEPVVLCQINHLSIQVRIIWLQSAGVVKGGVICGMISTSEILVLKGKSNICALDMRGKEKLNYLIGLLSIGSGT